MGICKPCSVPGRTLGHTASVGDGAAVVVCCLVTKSCRTLCDPMDCSTPGSPVPGISQARILEWVAISFSRGSSQPRDWTHVFFTTEPPGKPWDVGLLVSILYCPTAALLLRKSRRGGRAECVFPPLTVGPVTYIGQLRQSRCEVRRNLKYGCAWLALRPWKEVPQGPDNPRRTGDTWCRPGLNPHPGAETQRAWLRSDEPQWQRDSSASHFASYFVSLLQFETGPQPSQPRHFWRLLVSYFGECLSVWFLRLASGYVSLARIQRSKADWYPISGIWFQSVPLPVMLWSFD